MLLEIPAIQINEQEVMFKIILQGNKKNVLFRNLSHINNLNLILNDCFPMLILPSLPLVQFFTKGLMQGDNIIELNRYQVQVYLNKIVNIESIKESEFIVKFFDYKELNFQCTYKNQLLFNKLKEKLSFNYEDGFKVVYSEHNNLVQSKNFNKMKKCLLNTEQNFEQFEESLFQLLSLQKSIYNNMKIIGDISIDAMHSKNRLGLDNNKLRDFDKEINNFGYLMEEMNYINNQQNQVNIKYLMPFIDQHKSCSNVKNTMNYHLDLVKNDKSSNFASQFKEYQNNYRIEAMNNIKKYAQIQIKYERTKLDKIRKDYHSQTFNNSFYSSSKSENSSYTEDSPPLPSIVAFLYN